MHPRLVRPGSMDRGILALRGSPGGKRPRQGRSPHRSQYWPCRIRRHHGARQVHRDSSFGQRQGFQGSREAGDTRRARRRHFGTRSRPRRGSLAAMGPGVGASQKRRETSAKRPLTTAEQFAKLDPKAHADQCTVELTNFQTAGDKAQTAWKNLALKNTYWKSQGEFRTARESLEHAQVLFKSRPEGSDPICPGAAAAASR